MRPGLLAVGGCAVALVSLTQPARAQGRPLPEPGTRIRITQGGDHQVIGRFIASRDDTLLLLDSSADTIRVATRGTDRIEMSRGRKPALLRGAGMGFLIGGAGGAVLGAATYEDPCRNTTGFCLNIVESRANAALIVGSVFAVGGAAGGAILGLVVGREQWQATPR